MSWGAFLGIGLGLLQSYEQNKYYKQQLKYEEDIKLSNIAAAQESYKANVDALIIRNYINEEEAANAITEVKRAQGASLREAAVDIRQAASNLSSKAGGIAAGASRARELSSFYVEAGKMTEENQNQYRQQVIQIADASNKAKGEILAQAEAGYQQLKLSIAGVNSYSSLSTPSLSNTFINIGQGIQLGKSFQSSYADLTATNTARK